MFGNPLVQTLFLVFGAYTGMTLLQRYSPLHLVVTALAGFTALVVWMLRYNRGELHGLYQNMVLKHAIDLVCSMTGEQPPVDAAMATADRPAGAAPAVPPTPVSSSMRPRAPVSARTYANAPAPQSSTQGASVDPPAKNQALLLTTDADARLAALAIKQRLFGLDAAIDLTLEQIVKNVKVRERGLSNVQLPPLGLFLFNGRAGLGKRALALDIGRRLYSGDAVGVLDLSEPGQTLDPVIASAKTNPYQTFIIENIDQASRRVQDDLLGVVSGQALVDGTSGARVSFRHCCVFLLIHKEADPLAQVVISGAGQPSFTIAVERTAGDTALDALLAQCMHGLVPFRMPDRYDQAHAIAAMMAMECEKYQLALGSVSPQTLAREVQHSAAAGTFRGTPARVARLLGGPIHSAIEAKSSRVDVP